MLPYAETASGSTIVPVEAVSFSQYQKLSIDPLIALPSSNSYAIGPLDPAQFTTLHARLARGATCSLLVPLHLPLSFFSDPQFEHGYAPRYLSPDRQAQCV